MKVCFQIFGLLRFCRMIYRDMQSQRNHEGKGVLNLKARFQIFKAPLVIGNAYLH